MIRKLFGLMFIAAAAIAAHAQAVPAALRAGSIEVGGFGGVTNPDYGPHHYMGTFGIVGDINARKWWGLEAEGKFTAINGYNSEKEFGFFVGPRFIYSRSRWSPYAKAEIGIGHLSFPSGISEGGSTNLAYEFGGGVDWRWKRHLTVRVAEFNYQFWPGFGNANDVVRRAGALTPWDATAGLKWRF